MQLNVLQAGIVPSSGAGSRRYNLKMPPFWLKILLDKREPIAYNQ
jgi:hypothetical protein